MQTQQEKKQHSKHIIFLFFLSQSITLFGSTLVQMAVVWYATLYTSSGIWVAAFSVCSYLPQFLVSFPGGVWADRYDRKRLIMGADLGIAAVTLLGILILPRLSGTEERLALLLAMLLIRSVGAGVQTPAVNAVIPELAPKEELMRCNAVNASMQSLVQFAAPAAAGILLTVSTLKIILWIDILTAVLGVGILSFLPVPAGKEIPGKQSIISEVKQGAVYAISDRTVGRVLTVYGLFTFFCVPAGFLAGLLVSRVYGNTYGYLAAAELAGFAGMMAGGFFVSIWGNGWKRRKTLKTGLLIFGMMAAGMGMTKYFAVYLVLMGIYGIALTVVQTSVTTILQETARPSMRGSVFGMMGAMYAGCMPLGMAVFGPLSDLMPLQWLMEASGIFLVLLSLLFFTDEIS